MNLSMASAYFPASWQNIGWMLLSSTIWNIAGFVNIMPQKESSQEVSLDQAAYVHVPESYGHMELLVTIVPTKYME